MDEYRAFVEKVANGIGPSDIIQNRTPEHAATIYAQLFKSAENSVLIMTKDLPNEVFGTFNVIEASLRFLASHALGRVSILIEDDSSLSQNVWLKAIREAGYADRVEITAVPKAFQSMYAFRCSVVDGKHFRIELDRTSNEASVMFRNPEFGGPLVETFEKIEGFSKGSRVGMVTSLHDREHSVA